MTNKVPPNKIVSICELLYIRNADNVGLSGFTPGTACKMTNVAGIYILSIFINFIWININCVCIGLDCASTSDQIKYGH